MLMSTWSNRYSTCAILKIKIMGIKLLKNSQILEDVAPIISSVLCPGVKVEL